MLCTKCGKEINKGIKYCVSCGNVAELDSETIIKAEEGWKSASNLLRLLLIIISSLIAVSLLVAVFASIR